MPSSADVEDKATFVLLFARNHPSCDVPYLMAQRDERVYPAVLTTTFYFMRDLIDYRAISLRNTVYIIGGRYASTGRLTNGVFKYDAETDFWRACEPMKAARANFAVTIFDSKIYVLGGEGQKGVIVQAVEAYDPAANAWKEVGTFVKPKRYQASLAVQGKLWSSGGANSLVEAKSTNELVLVDPQPSEWKRSITNYTLSEPCQQHCLMTINNNILLFGGCRKNGDDAENIQSITRATQESPESAPQWEELADYLRHPRTDCGYFQLGSSLYVIGGHDCRTGDPTKVIERIDFSDAENIAVEEEFEIDKNLGAVDCCVVQANQYNEHLLPVASFLSRWIVW